MRARPKMLPGLGGIKKNYIKKASCLETVLLFLAQKLKAFENLEIIKNEERQLLNQIKMDIIRLSQYGKTKKFDFYLAYLNILNNY